MTHPPKRICPAETDPLPDRLSGLPDELLHSIFAFLPDTKTRVRTCVLSRRWVRLWRSHPSIDLHIDHVDPDDDAAFDAAQAHKRALSAALSAAPPESLVRFSIDFWLPSIRHPSHFIAAYQFFCNAKLLRVRQLSLRFQTYLGTAVGPIPEPIFGFRGLEVLKIDRGNFSDMLDGFEGFPDLRILVLEKATIGTEPLAALLAGCPQLESFRMEATYGVESIDITPEKLPKLGSFALSTFFQRPVQVHLETPKLTSFWFEGHLRRLSWSGSPCLVEALVRDVKGSRLRNGSSWMGLVSALSNAQILTVNAWFYKFVIPNNSLDGSLVFKNLKKLTCEIDWVTCGVLHGLLSNLTQCPLLESLCIELNRELEERGNRLNRYHLTLPATDSQIAWFVRYVQSKFEKDSSDLLMGIEKLESGLHKLKIIKVEKFIGTKNEVRLVKFLIRIAHNLEKVSINDFYKRNTEVIRKRFASTRRTPRVDLHKIFSVCEAVGSG